MKTKATPQKLVTLSSLTVLLSMTTVFLGAPFLRALRKSYGPLIFWVLGLLVTAGAWFLDAFPLSVLIGSVWMTSGVYIELEQRGLGWWVSGLFGLAAGSTLGGLGVLAALRANGINTYAEVQQLAEQLSQKVTEMNPAMKVDATILLQQAPSALVIVLAVALGVGLIFEKSVFSWLNLPREKVASQLKLLEYRLPDYFIWVAMTAFLLSMVSFGGKATAIVAVNVLNIAVVLYFFQGLAVLEVLLNSIKAGLFTRILTYIILVGQMLLVLSIVGLIDYWVDFRGRIRRMTKPAGTTK